MDEATKREILDPIMTAIAASDARSKERHEETHAVVAKVASDHVGLREDFTKLRERVEVLEGRGGGWDGRLTGTEAAVRDGIAEAKRIASEVAADTEATLAAVETRYEELADGVVGIREVVQRVEAGQITDKETIKALVLEALGEHVVAIEEAADKLTNAPRVKTAAAVGGAFAGSAAVAAAIEIAKHFF